MARDRRTIRAGAREETRRERGVAGRAVDATPASVKARRHIDDFFTEYDGHHDVMRARGEAGGERHKALRKLANKPDAKCSERELKLKELLGMRTREEHLDDFFTEYDGHHDVMRARGEAGGERHKTLRKLANKRDAECSERELKLKELLDIRTREEHLDDFFTEYDDHHDFTRARGAEGGGRYKALRTLAYKPDAECSERELKLKELLAVLNGQEREAYNRRRDERYRRDAIVMELQELRRDIKELQSRRDYSIHLGCACAALLAVSLFKFK